MIRRLIIFRFFFQLCCYLLPAFSFLISAAALRSLGLICPLSLGYIVLGILLTLSWVIACEHFEVTGIEGLFLDTHGVRNCVKAVLWTYMSGFTALFFYRGESYSRLMFGVSGILLMISVLFLRDLFRGLIVGRERRDRRVRVIVVGSDSTAAKVAERLVSSRIAPCEVVAFVRMPGQVDEVGDDVPVYDLTQLLNRNVRNFADDVVIAVSPATLPVLSLLVNQLQELAIPVRLIMDFGSGFQVRNRFFRIGGTDMLDVHIAPSETISYVILKRCFDVAFSVLVLTVMAIPMLLIALAIKLTSAGPVFFVQERVGINGQLFRMLKFRTMQVTTTEESNIQWTTPNASRRTAIGGFLRKSSLDELPQFLNVLKGDMSVVGPRPERPHFVEKFSSEIEAYNVRHHLKSGITGWAQVCGLRGDTDISKRVQYDIYYMQNWSFFFDLQIIFMTIFSGFFAQNAY